MLTDAIGMGRPSLYAAFGDKRALFDQALERYVQTHGSYGAQALAEPTARAAVEKLLTLATIAYTEPDHPPGCLVISSGGSNSPASEDVAATLRLGPHKLSL
ncbi:MAG: TetR/AcrR family transcriptional regulator [Acidimicrobiales bacterium]